MALVELALKILKLLKNTVGKSFFLCLDVASAITGYGMIVVWSMVIERGKLVLDKTGETPVDVIQQCAGLSKLTKLYVQFATASITLAVLRMLQYLTFSKKLSAFQEITFSAAFDLLFFCLLWATMLFGFAVAFFASYGLELYDFRNVTASLT